GGQANREPQINHQPKAQRLPANRLATRGGGHQVQGTGHWSSHARIEAAMAGASSVNGTGRSAGQVSIFGSGFHSRTGRSNRAARWRSKPAMVAPAPNSTRQSGRAERRRAAR